MVTQAQLQALFGGGHISLLIKDMGFRMLRVLQQCSEVIQEFQTAWVPFAETEFHDS